MWWYSIKPRTGKHDKGRLFFSFARKYKKQLLNIGVYFLKTASQKVVHKGSKSLENKIADQLTKSKDDKIVKQEPVQEIIIPPEKEMIY